jgi:hypothetical protein
MSIKGRALAQRKFEADLPNIDSTVSRREIWARPRRKREATDFEPATVIGCECARWPLEFRNQGPTARTANSPGVRLGASQDVEPITNLAPLRSPLCAGIRCCRRCATIIAIPWPPSRSGQRLRPSPTRRNAVCILLAPCRNMATTPCASPPRSRARMFIFYRHAQPLGRRSAESVRVVAADPRFKEK